MLKLFGVINTDLTSNGDKIIVPLNAEPVMEVGRI